MKNVNSVVNMYVSVIPALLQAMQEAEDDKTNNISTAHQPGNDEMLNYAKRNQLTTFTTKSIRGRNGKTKSKTQAKS